MSFFDVHFLQRKFLALVGEGQAINQELQKGNTHKVVIHHNQLKKIFYQFIRHYKKIINVDNISVLLLASEQLHKFLECLFSIHSLIEECLPTIESDIPDLDMDFHVDLAFEINEIISTKKKRIIS